MALSSGWCSRSMASTRKPYSVSRSSHSCGARTHIWVGRGGSSRSRIICSRGATSVDGPRPCRSVCRSERISGAPGRRPLRSAGSARCGSMKARVPMAYAASNGSASAQVLGHVSLANSTSVNVRVGGDGAFVLGRGQLDPGDASAVGSREMHGVVAGPGADVQDAAAGDVAEDFSPWSDPLPGRPGQLVGDGRGVGAGQLALAVDLPGSGVGVLGWARCLLGGRDAGQVCVIR